MYFAADDPAPTPWPVQARVSSRALNAPPRIDVIRIEITIDATFGIKDFLGDDAHERTARLKEAADLLSELASQATSAVRDLAELLRMPARQPWLTLSGEAPVSLSVAHLLDLDANRMLPVSLGLLGEAGPRTVDHRVLVPDELRAVIEGLQGGQKARLPESLLADALYYNMAASPRDPTRALLSAAVACEVKVKETLDQLVKPEAKELLDLLLRNPRDWSLQAAALFTKAMAAVAGKSLKKENPGLAKRITRLFEVRNDVAHRGAQLDDVDVDDLMRAAMEAFRWLDSVCAARRTGG